MYAAEGDRSNATLQSCRADSCTEACDVSVHLPIISSHKRNDRESCTWNNRYQVPTGSTHDQDEKTTPVRLKPKLNMDCWLDEPGFQLQHWTLCKWIRRCLTPFAFVIITMAPKSPCFNTLENTFTCHVSWRFLFVTQQAQVLRPSGPHVLRSLGPQVVRPSGPRVTRS